MKKIEIKNHSANFNYYLLEPREVKEEEISDFIKSFMEKDEKIKIIDEGGIKATANRFVVIKRDLNNKYVDLLLFDEDSDFTYLE